MNLQWERKVYEIALRAQEKEGTELEYFLGSACGGNVELRLAVEKQLDGIHKVVGNSARLHEWFKRQK